MPNTGNYHLYIHSPVVSTQKSPVAKGANGTGNGTGSTEGEAGGGLGLSRTERALKGMVTYAAVSSFADRLISNELSTVELRTGAREYEQQLQFGYGLAKKGVNAAVTLGIGIATGTWPVIMVGAVLAGATKMAEIGQNMRVLEMQENLEGISIQMANTRAGTSGRRGQNQ